MAEAFNFQLVGPWSEPHYMYFSLDNRVISLPLVQKAWPKSQRINLFSISGILLH